MAANDAGREVHEVRSLVEGARRVVALTGAGISTDSGIPDFRGPQGVWTRDPEAERRSNLRQYLNDPEVRRQAWRSRLSSPAWNALPNAGHRALVALERRGQLDTVVTQNIDELHQRAGNDPARVVELHGTMFSVVCWSCGARQATEDVLVRVRAGEEDPACTARGPAGQPCGGILKSATVSFGEDLAPGDIERARTAVVSCDLLLAVGSSLTVYPAAGLVPLASRAGATVVIINAEPTPYDEVADAVLRRPISEVLPAVVGLASG
ncbi:MAG: Sir2 family NAD-dependent protein deacetylase [Acidimicrobiales bacterium]|nr:Sir2 family NAD-dependent protein deacetylase [Acidimicrobiales bacterium]